MPQRVKTFSKAMLTLLIVSTANPVFSEEAPKSLGVLQNLYPDAPLLNTGDWRSASLAAPWSTPVIVKDDFDGDYLAVFDKNYRVSYKTAPALEEGIISNWSKRYIRVYAYQTLKRCVLPGVCQNVRSVSKETGSLDIRVGEQVFRLVGNNGNYPVSPELSTALYQAPTTKAKIRVTLKESGAAIVNDIGEKTVASWKVVFKPE